MMRPIRTLLPIVIAVSSLFGCSTTPIAPGDKLGQCQQQLKALQRAVHSYGTGDAQYQPVDGFPTYRTNRFWSSFNPQALTPEQAQAQRRQLHHLGMNSLEQEWHNLPSDVRKNLPGAPEFSGFTDFQQACDQPLFNHSLTQPLTAAALQVPDSYNDWLRFFGFYALVKYAATGSIAEYQQEMTHRISGFEQLTPPSHYYQHSQPQAHPEPPPLASWLEQAYQQNALGVPQLTAEQWQATLAHHAPQYQIAQASPADRPGAAGWITQQGALTRHIDDSRPLVYTYPSYIRFRDQILLQLNYTLWFSERPKPTPDDWYGGKLDGLVWRVTLQADGSVLMYDSIHPCGCYHSVHVPEESPLHSVVTTLDQSEYREPILFFTSPPQVPVKLSLEAGTHYLVQVEPVETPPQQQTFPYRLEDYDTLRSLPVLTGEQGYRSWFDEDGLIAASERRERYFLWPLGVENAGAMRQQGHHAIAFVGKRHFDEPSVERLLNLPR